MRKQVLFLLTMLLSVWTLAQDVKVTHNLPASASAGETIDAQFTVTKGSIGAFAKFQCDVPAGTQAAAVDTKSGNFTFENNRIKIVWVSLPGDATFTFSVKITLSSSASGSLNFTSQFYYLENNVKKEFDLPAHAISVGGGGATTTTSTPTTSTTENTTATTTSTPTTTATETTTSTPTVAVTENTTTTTTPTTSTTENKVTTTTTETKTTTTPTTTKSGVTYYLQVAALSTDPGMLYKKYGKMKVVVENGMYKVLIGGYSSIEEARKLKPAMIEKGAVGCFVVGYENGVRIKL
ncbi:MAG TPA: SPOR domain-containing protein [Bacteroidia bacterium]|jgi:hypothetical protein|nr:SPOR domain-containing protein [Bacteroidia bacterium]